MSQKLKSKMKPTVLIVGASRGIGLGFVSKFLSEGWNVHATARKEADIAAFPSGVTGHLMDVTNQEQIESVAAAFASHPIDLLIHNAGVGKGVPADVIIQVNVKAPFSVIDAFLPAVAASQQKKIGIMSSQLGSRERFGNGETPTSAYGASKCLLNDKFREEEPKWKVQGVSSIVVHPGWVQTDMGGPTADITVQESVNGMYELFSQLSEEKSGKFFTYAGLEHPW